ncbi:MAG: nucleotidyl transferase AbiEii/AbiGii toxin family protein [Micromonosporaceae bacterium]
MSKTRPTRAGLAGRTYLDLQNLARRTGQNTQHLLQLYALEGFLARLAMSPYASRLVLKGGVLLSVYDSRRPTRDIDLQAQRLPNDDESMLALVRQIAATELADGLILDPASATARRIRDGDAYGGVRISLEARLASSRIPFHVDVNVGDPIWPGPQTIVLPGLLDRRIELAGYPMCMVHAEKLVTMIDRGTANTRWRDFADVYTLSGRQPVEASELTGAMTKVAAHRQVRLVLLVDILDEFPRLAQRQWETWRRTQGLTERLPYGFDDVLAAVIRFADPVLAGEVVAATWDPVARVWPTTA